MTKTLKDYVDTYLEITANNPAERTIPPAYWVFSMWQRDEKITEKEPEEAYALLHALNDADPQLAAVIWQGVEGIRERTERQSELQAQGANVFELIRVGKQVELIPTSEARAAALALLDTAND